MEKKLLLIVNPVSGTKESKTALFDILQPLCKEGFCVTVMLTQYRGHAIKLAEEAFEKGYTALACCGGDGTLNETLTGMLKSSSKNLPLGYIPLGSTNDFAATLGLSLNPKQASLAISKGKSFKIDVGKFGMEHYFSYIASFGAFTQASYSAPQELKNIVGHMAYLLEGLKDISNLKTYRVSAVSEEYCCQGDYIFGSVSNTRSVGGIVKLKDGDVDLDDGLFEVILVKNPQTALDLNNIISGIIRSDFSSPIFEFFKTSKVKFSFENEVFWSLDGEKVKSPNSIEIENIHKAVEILK